MVQKWEYLEVRISGPEWADSRGNSGKLEHLKLRCLSWHSATPMMNELGEQGWEMSGIADDESLNSYIIFFKRLKTVE